MFEFKLPDLGEGVHEGQIVSVLVEEGAPIKAYEPMLEVETDKAAVEIPSPKTGIVSKINVEAGQVVHVGDVLIVIDDGEQADDAPVSTATAAATPLASAQAGGGTAVQAPPAPPRAAPASAPPPAPRGDGPVPAAPVVRKLARELGVDINQVPASGPNNRILREDVERFAGGDRGAISSPATSMPSGALPDFDQYGPVRREKLSQIRKTIAKQMTRAWLSVPRVTHGDNADITDIESNRKKFNKNLRDGETKLSTTAIVMKVVAAALRHYPMLNCSFDAENNEVVYKDYVHLGIAVDTPRGLVVPVLRDADKKSLPQIATDLAAIAERTRTGKFEIADLRGATFTITNVGILGGTYVTPMVNFPEVGILGLGRGQLQPKVMDDMSIVPRIILPISLSFDHRICDGADAARFTRDVIDALENPLRLLSLG